MTRKDAIAAMRQHSRFYSGEPAKWLPILTAPGVEGFKPMGTGWLDEVAVFVSFPMTKGDDDTPWCKEVGKAAQPTMAPLSIYPIREVENFIPLEYGHMGLHDHVRVERVVSAYTAKASAISQAELGFALHALGCKPPITYGCVDRKTWTLGFECHSNDYAVLRLAPAFTRERVNDLIVEARQGGKSLAAWSMDRIHAKAMEKARSDAWDRKRLREPKNDTPS